MDTPGCATHKPRWFAHGHLNYPFVLSWSCLETRSAGCPVVGSRTGPVTEFIKHDDSGSLLDFFDVTALADTLVAAVDQRPEVQPLHRRARETAVSRCGLQRMALPQYQALIERIMENPVAHADLRAWRKQYAVGVNESACSPGTEPDDPAISSASA